LNEKLDLIRREVDAPETEVCQGFDPAAAKSNPEPLVSEQLLDGEFNHAFRHADQRGK